MDFPHCFLILLSICGHYYIYFCVLRNSEITMREMVVTIRLLMTPFCMHSYVVKTISCCLFVALACAVILSRSLLTLNV